MTCWTDGDADNYGASSFLADDGDCTDSGEAAVGGDCDDGAPAIYPGAAESCDAVDSDCDGSLVDEFGDNDTDGDPDCTDPDDDNDGDPDTSDCDDTDAAVYTGAPETPDDGIDQDCSGSDTVTCFEDLDGDGYGTGLTVLAADGACDDLGESAFSTDCDDTNASTWPGAPEFCDAVDADCDGSFVDEFADTDSDGDPDCTDLDDDGDGDPDSTDCDDTDPWVFAGAPETPDDGVDQDCDGFDGTECYEDWDGDGYGDPLVIIFSVDDDCDDAGESPSGDDCDDVDSAISPAATEMDLALCLDGLDQDCDGLVDTDDDSCACSVQRAMVASQTFPCPAWLPVSGVGGAFDVSTATLDLVDDPDPTFASVACTQPLLLRTDTDIRGLTVGIDGSSLGTPAIPAWAGSSMTATSQYWQPGVPENCSTSSSVSGTASCAFPGTPSTAPGVECYAVSFWASDSAAGQTADLFASVDRTSAGAERLDVHAVIAGTTPITEEQVTDVLSYAAQAFETQGISLGTVSFEAIPQYAVFDLATELPDVAAAPTGAGATDRAVTVIFVDNIVSGPPEGVIGISSGLPGLLGTSGNAGAAVVVEVSTFMASPPANLEGLGLDVAHEVGHFLGLNHTTQINWNPTYGWLHDFLPDTPECIGDWFYPTEGPPVLMIWNAICGGAGAENVMFPMLGGVIEGMSFTDQQGDVIASTAPGPLTTCVDSTDCFDDEVCIVGECERAWARPYTLYIDGASVASSGPSGAWDALGGAPDPFVDWVVDWGVDSIAGVTSTDPDTYFPTWYETWDIYALKSSTEVFFGLYDEDLVSDDLIDYWYYAAPLPLEWLQSPYLPLTESWSTLDIGFEPQ